MDKRYPIGQFSCPIEVQEKDIQLWVKEMTTLPNRLNMLVLSLDELELTKTYREGSWNVRQLIHHIVDSHINGYMRMKLALTEVNPLVKTYEESEWAKLIDYDLPIKVSLQLLESLHERWTNLLKNLTATQLQRTYQYPNGSKMRIEQSIALYAWHGNHHLAHIEQALDN
ncbi:YfiT family bacillithiol transferase [Paenibacillus motobuensis]|uniref:Putative metal-dependent hydrolase GCM10008933_47400 n=1 Tax=Paenibacillus motobuensis TaxID=295324 RepID=A0ABN0YUG5_9BACL